MNTFRNIKINLIIPFLCFTAIALGQETVLQVATKNIEKILDYKDGYLLDVDGEKADIQIETWDRNQIKVVIELIAKHENIEIATRDLESMGYNIEVVGKKIFVRNYLLTKKDRAKPESIFKANYVLTIPKDCPVPRSCPVCHRSITFRSTQNSTAGRCRPTAVRCFCARLGAAGD